MDSSRRAALLQALAGALAAASPAARAQLLGQRPGPLPAGRSIYELRGDCRINGRPATAGSFIAAGDALTTGPDSRLIFVVGGDAFLMRENSSIALAGAGLLVNALRVLAGALLSVSGGGTHAVSTPTATIGLRGSGLYVEVLADRSYVCLCYGTADIAAIGSGERETHTSRHHDAPRYVLAAGPKRILPAPLINHTDQELALLEALEGRSPPFAPFDRDYGAPPAY